MEQIIENIPNNTVAILCKVQEIYKNNQNYALIPQDVSFGHLDDEGYFITETGNKLACVDSIDINNEKELNDVYYYNPKSIDELKKQYKGESETTMLAYNYLRDLDEKILLWYKTSPSAQPTIETVEKREPRISQKINEDIEKKYYDKFVAQPIVKKNNKKNDNTSLSKIRRIDLATYLKERIIDNDSVIDDITTILVSNLRADNPELIENIMCAGHTGSGKSKTFKLIRDFENGIIPVTLYDCNELTSAGYVGKSVDDIMKTILTNARNDEERAARMILVFDEVDKIAMRGLEVKDEAVQHELLKILEGSAVDFEYKSTYQRKRVDSSLMTRVALGAFTGLFDTAKKHSLGFNAKEENISKIELTDEDIIKYGMKNEFVGRFRYLLTFKDMYRDGYVKVLKKAKDNPLALEQLRFKELYNCTLEVTDGYIEKLVDKALASPTGIRSIGKAVSSTLIKLRTALMDMDDMGNNLPDRFVLTEEIASNPKSFSL